MMTPTPTIVRIFYVLAILCTLAGLVVGFAGMFAPMPGAGPMFAAIGGLLIGGPFVFARSLQEVLR